MKSTSSTDAVAHALPAGCEGKELVYHGAQNNGRISLTAMSDRPLASQAAPGGTGARWDFFGYGFSLDFTLAHPRVTDEWLIKRGDSQPPQPGGDPNEGRFPLPSVIPAGNLH
jgi:hypothetical protein